MSGSINASGLISGIDSESLIRQLMQLERQPIVRLETQISDLETEQTAFSDLRTQLLTLRNRLQDFRLNMVFDKYLAPSSSESVLTAEISGADPVTGSYDVEILQLASATVATSSNYLGDAISSSAALNSSGMATEVNAGTFSINGQSFTIDPDTESLDSILTSITSSAAGVNASYDATTDKVTFANQTAGDTSIIIFGGSDDDSNFLSAINMINATQEDGASGETQAVSTVNLGAISTVDSLDTALFTGGTISGTNFQINGSTITFDSATDSLVDIIERINASDAEVTASYDATTDKIQVVSDTLGSRTVSFGAGNSNFLTLTNLDTAVQVAGQDSQFTVNGGATQTRNTNEVDDAIGGVTVSFLSVGTSTVTVSMDNDSIVEGMQEFVTAFNESADMISGFVGEAGAMEGDWSIYSILNTMWQDIFDQVQGFGDYESLFDIGLSTGDEFNSTAVAHLELDEEEFRSALRESAGNVEKIFANSDETGVVDTLFEYMDEITGYSGFINARAKSNGTIDKQISDMNDQMERLEDRITNKETILRNKFLNLEKLSAVYQQQAAALSALGNF